MKAAKEHKPHQSRVIQCRKGKNISSSWFNIATPDFIEKHVGDSTQAENIAYKRGIPICHVLDNNNIHSICNEVGLRVAQNNHGSRSRNPQTGHDQFYTDNKYLIYQIKYTNGKTKSVHKRSCKFFYDAPGPSSLIHHFDGIKSE